MLPNARQRLLIGLLLQKHPRIGIELRQANARQDALHVASGVHPHVVRHGPLACLHEQLRPTRRVDAVVEVAPGNALNGRHAKFQPQSVVLAIKLHGEALAGPHLLDVEVQIDTIEVLVVPDMPFAFLGGARAHTSTRPRAAPQARGPGRGRSRARGAEASGQQQRDRCYIPRAHARPPPLHFSPWSRTVQLAIPKRREGCRGMDGGERGRKGAGGHSQRER
mmetsp:Transcript_12850/g.34571  ORF Transcript_12850/g.34571 Transcript_12850/m.34571 type:complete len:222 (-) Transcript_12850:1-666(-)